MREGLNVFPVPNPESDFYCTVQVSSAYDGRLTCEYAQVTINTLLQRVDRPSGTEVRFKAVI